MFRFYFISLWVVLFAGSSSAFAETKTLTAEAAYIMGDGETPSFAEAMALQKAKQAALEEAGTYVESYTRSLNQDLTKDEIQTLAGGVVQVEVLEKTRTLAGDGLRVYTKIRATVTTDKMEELARRIKGKNVAEEYTKLQAEYARLSRELGEWKQRAWKTPQGQERDAVLDQIREREQAFTRTQKNEAAFFERLVSGRAVLTEARDSKNQVDDLIEKIKRSGYVVELGKIQAYEDQSVPEVKWFPWGNWPLSSGINAILTVPVKMSLSKGFEDVFAEAVHSLGGHASLSGDQRGVLGRNEFIEVKTYVRERPDLMFGDYRYGGRGLSFRPSGNRHLDHYFSEKLASLVLVIDLFAPGGNIHRCSVSPIVNRMLGGTRRMGQNSFEVDLRGANRSTRSVDTVLLLLETVTFSVEFKLDKDGAEYVDRISAHFEEKQDAPIEVCHLVLK